MKTQITEMLGIRYPIVQGGMQWVGTAELASAVANAGGLGILTALTQPTPEDLREDDIPNLILIPAAVRALKIPVIASGGIGDGRGMAAALALGAQGINMGTRFMCTREAPVHDNVKRALVAATERDTNLMFRTMHNTARVYKNAISDEVVAMEKRGAKFEEVRHLVAGSRGKIALRSGDVNDGVVSAGMVIGLIDDIPTCAELIERIVTQCRERLAAAAAMAAG